MTGRRPRYITANAIKLIDRRTADGLFLLIPTPQFRQAFFYYFALYARRHDISIYDLVLMSNHYHAQILDKSGKLPLFLHDFHAKMGHVIRQMTGHKGPVWDMQQRCGVKDVDTKTQFVNVSHYIRNNPVKAGICAHPEAWPGLITGKAIGDKTATEKAITGKAKVVSNEMFSAPKFELNRNANLPKELSLPMEDKVGLEGYSRAELAAFVEESFDAARNAVHQDNVKSGKQYLKVKNALKLKRHQRMKRPKQKKRIPKWVSEMKAGLKEKLAAFYQAYQEAWLAYKAGNDKVEFPHGTWQMVQVHGCACAEP